MGMTGDGGHNLMQAEDRPGDVMIFSKRGAGTVTSLFFVPAMKSLNNLKIDDGPKKLTQFILEVKKQNELK